jgi:light-regulated signal transduction histidine kinase (bacteriophytochrome)
MGGIVTHRVTAEIGDLRSSSFVKGSKLQSEELLESILESIGSGVIVTDSTGRFLLFNSMASKILGIGATDAKSGCWAETYGFYQSDKKTLMPESEIPLVRAMRGESFDKVEIFVRNEHVPWGIWCSATGRPLRDKSDTSSGGVVVFDDITMQKRLSDELMRSNKDLQQFAYVAAHDLQEPIRTIIGFGDLLSVRLEGLLDDKSKDHFNRVIKAARRMQNLITALLAFARVETRAKPAEVCDCNAALKDALGDLHSVITAAGGEINFETLPTIFAERTQITQLFQNLISNSLKYKSDKPPVIDIKVKAGDMHLFSLADNGIGFDMRYAERIFLIFQRLHSKTEYEGAGVGLSLCKRIVERHGGEIWVESTPGEGSTFYFTLPSIRQKVEARW